MVAMGDAPDDSHQAISPVNLAGLTSIATKPRILTAPAGLNARTVDDIILCVQCIFEASSPHAFQALAACIVGTLRRSEQNQRVLTKGVDHGC
jgi:hypothetical protein